MVLILKERPKNQALERAREQRESKHLIAGTNGHSLQDFHLRSQHCDHSVPINFTSPRENLTVPASSGVSRAF